MPISGSPSRDLGELAELLLACSPRPSTARAAGPSTATSPFSSWSEASAWSSDDQRVGRGAAVLPAVLGPGERLDLHRRSAPSRAARSSASARRGGCCPCRRSASRRRGTAPGSSRGRSLRTLPTSSCPSITSLIPTGGRPSQARSAPTCARMFDFVSAAPRPKIAPSRSVASNGGDSHFASSPRRDDVVVRVEQHGRRARRAPGSRRRRSAPCPAARASRRARRRRSRNSSHDRVERLEQRGVRLLRVAGRRDRGDRDELRQLVLELRHERRHARCRGCDVHISSWSGGRRRRPLRSMIHEPRRAGQVEPFVAPRARADDPRLAGFTRGRADRRAHRPPVLGQLARPRKMFSTPPGRRRFRRATDAFLLVPALLALARARPRLPAVALRAVARRVPRRASRPGSIRSGGSLYDALVALGGRLGLAALVTRRVLVVAAAAVASLGVALAVTVVSGRIALGRWPDARRPPAPAGRRLELRRAPRRRVRCRRSSSSLRTSSVRCSARSLGARPRPRRRAPGAGRAAERDVTAFASRSRRDDRPARLRHLGRSSRVVGGRRRARGARRPGQATSQPADRQPAGVFVARGEDAEGRSLLVKVYGRDAYDTQLLEKAWRTLLYQDESPRVRRQPARGGRVRGAADAARARSGSRDAGGRDRRDRLVGGRAARAPRRDPPARRACPQTSSTTRSSRGPGRRSLRSRRARIAHHRIDPETLVLVGGRSGSSTSTAREPSPPGRISFVVDRAQLLADDGLPRRASSARSTRRGGARRRGRSPSCSRTCSPPPSARALQAPAEAGEVDVDDLRTRAAEAVGVEAPELDASCVGSPGGRAVQVALLALAVSTLIGALAAGWTTRSSARTSTTPLGVGRARRPSSRSCPRLDPGDLDARLGSGTACRSSPST